MGKKKTIKETKKTWYHTIICNIFGLTFILLPTFALLSLFDYNPNDPSFNKVTTSEVNNFLGSFGSHSADLILSTFGIALIIYLFIPIIWGIGLIKYKSFVEYKARIFAWFVGVLSFACFIDLTCSSYLGHFNLPYNLTGEWSRILSRPINSYTNLLNIPYNTFIIQSIILFISILSFNFSAGITFKAWIFVSNKIFNFIKNIATFIYTLLKKVAKIKSYKEFKELNPNYIQSKMHKIDTNNKREPLFNKNVNTSAISNIYTQSPQNNSNLAVAQNSVVPSIEIPNKNQTLGNLAIKEDNFIQPAQKQKYNPTFDFMNDDSIANQNSKKNKKISPEDIYQTETQRKQTKNKTETSQQEELLSVDVSKQYNKNTPSSQQPSSNSFSEKDKNLYNLPDINLLSDHREAQNLVYDEETLKTNAAKLEEVLNDFGIKGQIVKVRPGPVVTLYELEPAPGTKAARVIGLSDDIARCMSVSSVRMAVVSGHNTIGIELPNEKRETVWLRELLEDKEFKNSKNILNVTLGKDIGGQHIYADLSKMPHLLVAGTTGSGKSVGVNSMIISLLYRMTPDECKLIMIDPKQLEFSMYNGIPHLLTPVITDPGKAVVGLKWAVREMEDRYRAMALLNVRNIAGYNQKVADMRKTGKEVKKKIQTGFDKETGHPIYEEQILDTTPMPYIVIVVDEMADLMLVAGKEVEAAIQRLAQMARAAGIHLIMSTQRPSVDVITGTIKANFPSRISFHVTTKIDSRTILGEQGAEQLLGMGDMLYMPSGLRPIRVHGCFVADAEVERIVEYIKSQGEPKYVSDVTEGELNSKDSGPVFDKGEISSDNGDDDLYNQAVAIVRADKKASTSYIQRKLRLGYNRAAILIERMEDEGIVTPPDRVGRREVIGVE